MVVPRGYKQTEVGVIPEDWYTDKLYGLVDVNSGESPSKFNITNGDTPYFKVEQLNNCSKYLSKTPYKVNSARKIIKGSSIFPKRGASILLNKVRILKYDSYFDTNLMSLTPKSDALTSEYLYYFLIHVELWRIADTTSIPQINNKHIKEVIISLPPKAEQTAIANVLTHIDELITSLQKLIEKKRVVKLGAMQELLTGKKRVGYNGRIPEERTIQIIGDIFEFKNGLNKGKEYFGYGIPIVNYMDVYLKRGLKSKDITGKVCLSKDEIRRFNIKKGDVFFTRTSETIEEVGVASVLLEDIEDGVFSGFILRGRPVSDKIQIEYCKYCFQTPSIRKSIVDSCTYTTRALTNGKQLSKIHISLPPKSEQSAIADILTNMDDEIELLEQKLAKYEKIKIGMMQNLLTGKIRLPTP